MPKYDNEMQATKPEIAIIQPIIDQIRAGNTNIALQAIESLDKTIIDKIILEESFDQYNSILRAAVENSALEVINKLIEKRCNLEKLVFNNPISGTVDDALSLWIKTVAESNMSVNLLSTGQTLLEASQKKLFDETIFQMIQDWILEENLPTILYGLLGTEKFIQLLFSKDRKLKDLMSRVPVFKGYLKVLVENGIKITQDSMFMLHLISLSVPKYRADDFYQAIGEYSETLHKNIIPTETKSLSESELKVLLEPQITSPMDDFPDVEYWRLFVDGVRQISSKEKGWFGYEFREPRCLQKMYDAFIRAREHLDTEELSYELTDEIHQIATGHFQDHTPKNFRIPLNTSNKGPLINGLPALMSGDTAGSLTYQGFLEITKAPYSSWYILKNRHNVTQNTEVEPTDVVAIFSDNGYKNEKEIIATIKKIVEEYHKNLNVAIKANDRSKQLQCIIKLASDYARFHPYTDGNNRTAVCILNRELQKQSFPLAILNDPNQLEGHSQTELFTRVCEGMQNFLTVKAGKPYPNSKTTDEFTKENRDTPPPIKLALPTTKVKAR